MTVSERALEEDEVKIDNLLHKILKANEQIEDVVKHLRIDLEDGKQLERLRMIDLLTETVKNLALLADEIDIHDEHMTEELETRVQGKLQDAIVSIQSASKIL